MITAAALTFPCFRAPVTRVSGRRATTPAPACGAKAMTCIYATKVTIYSCRISRAIVDCRGAPTADTAFMGLTSCQRVTIAMTLAHRRRECAIGIMPIAVPLSNAPAATPSSVMALEIPHFMKTFHTYKPMPSG